MGGDFYDDIYDVMWCVTIGHNFNVFTGIIIVFYRIMYDQTV